MRKEILLLLLFLTACTITGQTTAVSKEYGHETEVYFCPRDDCDGIFVDKLRNATEINCAIYDVNLAPVVNLLKNKNARLVLDDESSERTSDAVIDPKYTQMHNKFCVLDDQTVITGSMNPTFRDTSVNSNNLLIIHSKNIANLYNEEFEELHSGEFSGGEESRNNVFYVNNDKIEVYFCPEDWCANKILHALDSARESVYFMTFSFTHDQIGDVLVEKKRQGLTVKGIMETSQKNAYTEFDKLLDAGIDVRWDNNTKANLHHKAFIIDQRIVVTGSMNPTLNGDTKNDENLLIIESPRLAQRYLQEFVNIFPRN
jgi:phosphatidylserine/phosphatidylglycerophosphate/cardiolipin synthase-like enzyme